MIGAIIQARMGSNRLPGKMQKVIGNQTLIDWVIYRLNKSRLLNKIILASTIKKEDKIFAEIAKKFNIKYFFGNENDVLNRYYEAALENKLEHIVRICADNPFVDPIQIDNLIDFYKKNSCDYTANNQNLFNSGYADGFGAEIFSFDVLSQMKKCVFKQKHKEHVTLYIKENPTIFNVKPMKASKKINFPNLKFDIDTIEDLKKIRNIADNGAHMDSTAIDILKIYLSMNKR